jgi:RNA polymerase sigma-70 factor (ECF subfamily)
LPGAGGRVTVPGVGGDDARLAARLTAGDDRALAEIFDRLAPAVHAAAFRVLRDQAAAQDVVQDVFVDLWSRPGQYDPDTGALHGYLVLLARHRAVDVVRSELRRLARQERSYNLTPQQRVPSPAEQVIAMQADAAVRAALGLLPESQRRMVELAYFNGMTCREAARVAGIPEGTAKSRLRLALARLESVLDRQLLESP